MVFYIRARLTGMIPGMHVKVVNSYAADSLFVSVSVLSNVD